MASIKLVIILTIVIQYVDGYQRIVQVSELFSDDEDFFTSGDGDFFTCCVYGNCSCNSLDYALAQLTSNLLINITTDATLSSIAKVSDFENVAIIGHSKPTVNCRKVGGMHFTFCHNCIIKGIIWDGCGTKAEPGLKLSYSSNITIQNCSFQHSIGPAVVLSEVTDVNINHCQFVYNSHYRGHGAAVHYSSSNATNHLQPLLTIKNCNFTNNKGAKSLVYIENRISEHADNVMLYYSKFCHNQGTSIYVINQKLSLSGKLLFQNNTAKNGTGIYITNHSTVIFGRNSNVEFIQNFADHNGGVIFLCKHSTVLFNENSKIRFNYNKATIGTVYSRASSNVTFTGTCMVEFNNNTATEYGAAIYSFNNSHVIFANNSKVIFSGNLAYAKSHYGKIIYSENYGRISLEDNSSTALSNNVGGAIYSCNNSHISFEDNSSTIFGSNTADCGGAIYSCNNSHISFEDNSSTNFFNNIAENDGGAICSNDNSHISFEDNSSIIFGNNTAGDDGGVIFSRYDGHILFLEGSSTMFKNNTAEYGGAIYSIEIDHISFEGNSTIRFNNNTATHNGGAIYCYTSNISFSEYSTIIFINNIADYGGAVFAELNSDITFSDNSITLFTTNRATFGATVYSYGNSKIMTRDNSTATFDDHSTKWCANACLPYTGQSDVVTIDGDGIVWCANQKAFVCLSIKCDCKNLEDSLNKKAINRKNAIVNITEEVMILSSFIEVRLNDAHETFLLIGHNNLTIICVNGGRLLVNISGIHTSNKLKTIFESINWIGCGGYRYIHTPIILVHLGGSRRSELKIQKCSFQHSVAPAIGTVPHEHWSINIKINHCSFMNNNFYRGRGAVIYYSFQPRNEITINNCIFSYNHGALLINIIHENTIYISNSSFHNNQGVPIYLTNYVKLHIYGKVSFENNVADNGAGIYINDHSTITLSENSVVKFNNNTAINGTIYSKASSNVTFKANSKVTFSNNSATQCGSAIYSSDNSHVTFTGNSKVTFTSNDAALRESDADQQFGGTIFSEKNGHVSFEQNSTTVFYNNIAGFGAAIFTFYNSTIIFNNNSRVNFNDNIARTCGTLASTLFSSIIFNDNTKVAYNNNTVLCESSVTFESFAGAICTFKGTNIIFSGYSFIAFINNAAEIGGAVSFSESSVIMQQHSTVIFKNNMALYSSGGALVCSNNSNVTIKGNSNVTFNSNKANQNGGAVHSYNACQIIFKENSTSKFLNNSARSNGSAIFSMQASKIIIQENSALTFDSNTAYNGGTFYFTNSTITFNETSMISFFNNRAIQSGGVGYFSLNSKVLFEGNTGVRLENNKAIFGGAVLFHDLSNFVLTGNSNLSFVNNEAIQNGGAGYFYSHCNFTVNENARISFTNNKALHGGAICINDNVKFILKENTTVLFYINFATVGGGAIKVLNNSSIALEDFININFTKNSAHYGGAIFLDTTAVMVNNGDLKFIYFQSNFGKFSGDLIYQDVAGSCTSNCLNNRIVGISDDLIATQPYILKFYDPAICTDNDNDTPCNSYYVQNVMLGSEIMLPACVLDYYSNQINDSTQFLVHSEMHSNYFTTEPKQILISCDTFQGISIVSNQSLSTFSNFSINISLNVDHDANWKQISVTLIVGLSPCHPGFWQYPESQKCECYNANDIVFCSGNSSTIKRGYWFGSVTGKPTITFCPINYCNFTCCETTNGYYHLSPIRDNQCRSHRSGTACGSCTYSYTLSFDSTECVNVESCTAGQMVLVILLTVIYWIVMVALIFAMMYCKVEIGY